MSYPEGPDSARAMTAQALHSWWHHPIHGEELAPDGPMRNRRLTALAGLALLPAIALVVGSGAFFDSLWRLHYFAGVLLLPVATVKLASTGYRAARYYLRDRAYRQAGPPFLPMRLLAPALVASILVASITGVQMWLTRQQGQPWSTLHSASAFVFIVTAVVHLVFYIPNAVGASRAEFSPAPSAGRRSRRAAVAGTIAFGLVSATAVAATAQFPLRQDVSPGPGVAQQTAR